MHVTPSEASSRLLGELSKLTGRGQATIVRELLDEAVPAMQLAVEALRDMKKRPDRLQAAMARFSARAINDLTQAQLDLDSAMNAKPGRKPREGVSDARAASRLRKQGMGAANTG
jgi:predicted DNA-binding protein